jgi:uncharacterized protein YajQ (UPF0234 family)
MPSFDVVSEIDHHELKNALDQANREIGTRYDFKGSNSKIDQTGNELTLEAESEFQIKQMVPILKLKHLMQKSIVNFMNLQLLLLQMIK